MDFSQHRMINYDWIKSYQEKLGKTVFYEFVDKVYSLLGRMNDRQIFDLSTDMGITDKNRDLFIKVSCLYITEGHEHYSFSEDYTKILKRPENEYRKQMSEALAALKKKRQKKSAIAE